MASVKAIPQHRPTRALCLVVHAVTGGLFLATAWVIRRFFPTDPGLGPIEFGLHELGLAVLLLAVLPLSGVRPRFFLGLCVGLVSILLTTATAEIVFRRIQYDFRQQKAAWLKVPPYYRQPRTPTGTVYFRREGPQAWTGPVIRTQIELHGWPVPEVYRDEPVITVRYDAFGFRNEDNLTDWEIAIAGDSFTELGCLPYEQLFTTLLARRTGQRVRNLGVSSTGPFTQLSYLRDYGVSPSLRQVVIVFFEGNDALDMEAECDALLQYHATGERPHRDIQPQSSLIVALADLWRARRPVPCKSLDEVTQFDFVSTEGLIAVDVTQVPPALRRLPVGTRARLERFLCELREFADEHHARAALAYMPCKARVLQSRLQPRETKRKEAELWWPPELPTIVAEACQAHQVEFIDLTPALVAAAKKGELVFNPLLEVHLNARGSEVVAEELAGRLSGN